MGAGSPSHAAMPPRAPSKPTEALATIWPATSFCSQITNRGGACGGAIAVGRCPSGTTLDRSAQKSRQAAGGPGVAQFGVFRQLLLEDRLRLREILRQVRNAGIKDGGVGEAAEQAAGVAQRRQADLIEAGAQLVQLLEKLVAIAAPGEI